MLTHKYSISIAAISTFVISQLLLVCLTQLTLRDIGVTRGGGLGLHALGGGVGVG